MRFLFFIVFNIVVIQLFAQPVPTADENIPYLVTFGKGGLTSCGDDDFCQIFFFVIPKGNTNPIYIRVYDPDAGGEIDEQIGDFDTKTKFSVYGGTGCYTHDDARSTQPIGNYQSGNLLATKTFGVNEKYDKNWYTFGPFNPSEGEKVDQFGGFIFKVITEGLSGNDGNLYKYFLSINPDDNKPVEGGNAFTYEYTFRLSDNSQNVSHIYPFVDKDVISIKQSNFDWDSDGTIRIISVAKKGEVCKTSTDNNWESSVHQITDEEKNTSLDIQFVKNKNAPAKNNNVVLYITNQYGQLMKFYTSPIGGVPKYKYNIGVKKKTAK